MDKNASLAESGKTNSIWETTICVYCILKDGIINNVKLLHKVQSEA